MISLLLPTRGRPDLVARLFKSICQTASLPDQLEVIVYADKDDPSSHEIGNKPSSLGEIQGQYMGLLRFTPKGWAEVKRIRLSLPYTVRDKMHMTGTLQKIIESKNIEIEAIRYDGDWGEVDSTDYLAVCRRN